jgi:RHS repeat-associated protein
MAVGSNPPSYVPTDYSNNYDIEDRPKHGPGESNPPNVVANVGYDPSGKKVLWASDGGATAVCEIYFFSITGQRLAQFGCKFGIGNSGSIEWSVWMAKRTTHVGGQLTTDTDYDSLGSNPTARDITTDRLGSIRARGTERYTYYPYGEVRTSTGSSSLYAALESPVRGYDSNAGRFDRPDPLGLGAVTLGDPGSWNRFAYVQGDPVNFRDPKGLFKCMDCEDETEEEGPSICQTGYYYDEHTGLCTPYGGIGNPPGGGILGGGGGGNNSSGPGLAGYGAAGRDLQLKPDCAALIGANAGGAPYSGAYLAGRLDAAQVMTSNAHGFEPVTITPTGPAIPGGYTYSYQFAYTEGGNIYLNANYFPDPTRQNIKLPDGSTTSLLGSSTIP